MLREENQSGTAEESDPDLALMAWLWGCAAYLEPAWGTVKDSEREKGTVTFSLDEFETSPSVSQPSNRPTTRWRPKCPNSNRDVVNSIPIRRAQKCA